MFRFSRSSTTDGDDDSDQSTPMVIDSEAVEERESNERRIEERDGFSLTRKENEGSVEEAKRRYSEGTSLGWIELCNLYGALEV